MPGQHLSACDPLVILQVKHWITFNEPFIFTWLGHGIGFLAPGLSEPGEGVYQVAHNVIRAHTRAYHVYKNDFKNKQNGLLSSFD